MTRTGGLRPDAWVVATATLAALLWTGATVSATPVDTRWFEIHIDRQPCGWLRLDETRDEEGRLTVDEETMLRLVREGDVTQVRMRNVETTDAKGGLLRMSRTAWVDGTPLVTSWTFTEDSVIERRTHGDRVENRSHPRPEGAWIANSMVLRCAARDASDGAERTYRVIGPTTGLEPASRRVRPLPASDASPSHRRWEVFDTGASKPSIVVVDELDRLVRSETPLGPDLGMFEVFRVDRDRIDRIQDARLDLDGRLEIVPRVASDVGDPSRGSTLRARIRVPNGPLPSIPGVGGQRVVQHPDHLEILIDVNRGSPLSVATDRWLGSTGTLEIDDPEVVGFARRSATAGQDDWKIACQLRRAVERHINRKSYAVGFATAGQTVRSRGGDCSEHAVLLAAALRVHGLPSRLVTGLAWMPGSNEQPGQFVWHMWVQVVAEGEWRDLDPTLRDEVHVCSNIAFTISDGTDADLHRADIALLEILGRDMEIELVGRLDAERGAR